MSCGGYESKECRNWDLYEQCKNQRDEVILECLENNFAEKVPNPNGRNPMKI